MRALLLFISILASSLQSVDLFADGDGRPRLAVLTDLAQALWRVKHERGADGFAQFTKKFRVYDIDDQDGIADWMRDEFPGMFYILANARQGQDKRKGTYRGMY